MLKNDLLQTIKSGLIVSCQAPQTSPLHDPLIIAKIAQAVINQGAVGVRIDSPEHIQAVRQLMPNVPIIGLWKRQFPGCQVYITPQFQDAVAVSHAGADIIAIDATLRQRPQDEQIQQIIPKIQTELGKLVMADIDTLENGIAAAKAGADIIGTTLYGYTEETKHLPPPGYDLLNQLLENLTIPIICEGGIAKPEMTKKALELGAYTVVVGTAITGIEQKVQDFLLAWQ
jgi:N-acylglucosamine-6-phosphate 2-epimerase